MALPSRIIDLGRVVRKYGIAFALFPGDARFAIEIERADDDGGGAPDLGTLTSVGVLTPGEQLFIDTTMGSSDNIFHYRARHVRKNYIDGSNTAWFGGYKSALIPDTIPLIPADAITSLDVNVEEGTGVVTFSLNSSPRYRSIRYVISTSAYGDPSSGIIVALDADGDAVVDPSVTLARGQTAFLVVALYEQTGGVGTAGGTLRATGSYTNDLTVPDFTMRALVDSDWKASPELDGNFSLASAKIGFDVGLTPTEPSDSAVRARGTVDGRKISASDVNSAYGDIPVQLQNGETCIFKAFGYGATGGGGEESDDAVTAVISRTPDPPGLSEVNATVFDDGADLDWSLSFSFVGLVNTTDHQVNFQFFEEFVVIDTETGVAVDEGQPFAYSSIGAGGFSAGKKYFAEVSLISKSTGGVIDSLTTFPINAAT